MTAKSTPNFQETLESVHTWDTSKIVEWVNRLGAPWTNDAVDLVISEHVTGQNLPELIQLDPAGRPVPSSTLTNMCRSKYKSIDAQAFSTAVFALLEKGYLSTVGAVKVDGQIELHDKRVSMVDFAGQIEFMVSHQLLLSSMHTICMIIQPAPSFGRPDSSHSGSWDYWARFLASLGDRRVGSLLLAVSHLDKLDGISMAASRRLMGDAFEEAKLANPSILASPIELDYHNLVQTALTVRNALKGAFEAVAANWWVPRSYDTLSTIVQDEARRCSECHELPIVSRQRFITVVDEYCLAHPLDSELLSNILSDANLFNRAIEYLEATGEIMSVGEQLLIDPIGWFSSFLGHFIKDDLNVSSIQIDKSVLQRGTVCLRDIVEALSHDFESSSSTQGQIHTMMDLLCNLEMCVRLNNGGIETPSTRFLFPCLLPTLESLQDLRSQGVLDNVSAIRGQRFKEINGNLLPPGLFVGLLARMYRRMSLGTFDLQRMWRNCAVLAIKTGLRVIIKCDSPTRIIEIVAYSVNKESLFVGAAKGQASIVVWLAHLVRAYLKGYTQLHFDEVLLCPSLQCHGLNRAGQGFHCFSGTEYSLASGHLLQDHCCISEGCFRFIGKGHQMDKPRLCDENLARCSFCNNVPVFSLREPL